MPIRLNVTKYRKSRTSSRKNVKNVRLDLSLELYILNPSSIYSFHLNIFVQGQLTFLATEISQSQFVQTPGTTVILFALCSGIWLSEEPEKVIIVNNTFRPLDNNRN